MTSPTNKQRDAIIEECAVHLDKQEQHIRENANSLKKYGFMGDEARARELGAMFVNEAARALRMMRSDSPLNRQLAALKGDSHE